MWVVRSGWRILGGVWQKAGGIVRPPPAVCDLLPSAFAPIRLYLRSSVVICVHLRLSAPIRLHLRPSVVICVHPRFPSGTHSYPGRTRRYPGRTRRYPRRTRRFPGRIHRFSLPSAIPAHFSGFAETRKGAALGTNVSFSSQNPCLSRISATFLRVCRNARRKLAPCSAPRSATLSNSSPPV